MAELIPLALLLAIGAFNQFSFWQELNKSPHQSQTIAHGIHQDGTAVSVETLPIHGSLTTIVTPFGVHDHPLALVAYDGPAEGFLDWTQTAHFELREKFDLVYWDAQAGDAASVIAVIESRYEEEAFYYPSISEDGPDIDLPDDPALLDWCQTLGRSAPNNRCDSDWFLQPNSKSSEHDHEGDNAPDLPDGS